MTTERPSISAETDEALLVGLAQAGDEAAFAELVRRNTATSLRLAISLLRDREEAEDQVQTSFMKAWQHLGTFKLESRFSTWFKSIVRNQSLMRLRSLRQARLESLDEPMPTGVTRELADPSDTHGDEFERANLTERLHIEVRRLPGPMRQVLLMRDVEELPMEDVARRLDISVPALKSRLNRARTMLRERMQRHTLPPRALHL